MSIADKLVTIAENEQKVFDAGYIEGFKAVYGDILGTSRFPDKFWELYQEGGERTDYSGAFKNWSWYQFTPKYSLTNISNGYECFRNFNNAGANGGRPYRAASDISSTKIKVSGNADNMFFSAVIDHLGEVDFSKVTSFNRAFYASEIRKIDKLIWSDTYQSPHTPEMHSGNIFDYASTLENITIEGKITERFISFAWSTNLTYGSLYSIIRALADVSNQPYGFSYQLVLGSANIAKLTDHDLEWASNKGWEVL